MRIRPVIIIASLLVALSATGKVKLVNKTVTSQTEYALNRLREIDGKWNITISVSYTGEAEGFSILRKGKKVPCRRRRMWS